MLCTFRDILSRDVCHDEQWENSDRKFCRHHEVHICDHGHWYNHCGICPPKIVSSVRAPIRYYRVRIDEMAETGPSREYEPSHTIGKATTDLADHTNHVKHVKPVSEADRIIIDLIDSESSESDKFEEALLPSFDEWKYELYSRALEKREKYLYEREMEIARRERTSRK